VIDESDPREFQGGIDWLWEKYFGNGTAPVGGNDRGGPRTEEEETQAQDTTPAAVSQPPTPAASLPDEYIIQCCRDSGSSDRFVALWNGSNASFISASEADLSMLNILARFTQDPIQLDRIFRLSKRARGKWDRVDYRERTMGKAIKRAKELMANKALLMQLNDGTDALELERKTQVKFFLEEILGVDIIIHADEDKRYSIKFKSHSAVEMTAEDFVNFYKFRFYIMKTLDILPPMMKQDKWDIYVNTWLAHAERIYRSADETMIGVIMEEIEHALAEFRKSSTFGAVEKHPGNAVAKPFIHNAAVMFRMKWLTETIRFSPEKMNMKQAGKICRFLGFHPDKVRIGQSSYNLWLQAEDTWARLCQNTPQMEGEQEDDNENK
jgi:hypothetical protein